jgi:uncharacterized membrane protein
MGYRRNMHPLLLERMVIAIVALALFAEVFGLVLLFPKWGTAPKIILISLMIITLIVPVVVLVRRRKKFIKDMLN